MCSTLFFLLVGRVQNTAINRRKFTIDLEVEIDYMDANRYERKILSMEAFLMNKMTTLLAWWTNQNKNSTWNVTCSLLDVMEK